MARERAAKRAALAAAEVMKMSQQGAVGSGSEGNSYSRAANVAESVAHVRLLAPIDLFLVILEDGLSSPSIS